MNKSLLLLVMCSFLGACSKGGNESAKIAATLPLNCDIPENGNYCVFLGVQTGDHQMVRKGLEIGGDPNTKYGYSTLSDGTRANHTVVHEAIRLGDVASLELLVSHERFNPSLTVSFETALGEISTFTYLDMALWAGYLKAPLADHSDLALEVLSVLLRKCDPNVAYGLQSGTILHTVVRDSRSLDLRVLKLLVSNGADPKIVDKNGMTPGDVIESHMDSEFNSEQTRAAALGILK